MNPNIACYLRQNKDKDSRRWEAVLIGGNVEKTLFISRNVNKVQDYIDEINEILNAGIK
jgi:hypothetical protein